MKSRTLDAEGPTSPTVFRLGVAGQVRHSMSMPVVPWLEVNSVDDRPDVRYATGSGVSLAYTCWGHGEPTVLYTPRG